ITDPERGRAPDTLALRNAEMNALRRTLGEAIAAEGRLRTARLEAAVRAKWVTEGGAAVALLAALGLSGLVARRTFARAVDRYEAALGRSEASEMRLRRLWESNILGIMYTDAHGYITDANDAVLRLVGYTEEEVRARRVRWRELTPPEYAPLDDRGQA